MRADELWSKSLLDNDVVVVGGGAAGRSAAVLLGRSRRRVVVVDAGEPRNAPAGHMHGFLSRDGMQPAELLKIGRDEVVHYGGEIRAGRVDGLERIDERGFAVRLTDGGELTARALMVATGLRDELPAIPGLREQWARTVLQCPYCGFRQEITASNGQVREIALEDLDVLARKPVGQLAPYTLVCQRCAASTETTETAGLCQFCGSPLVMDAAATGQIIPEGVLPFEVDHNGIREALGKWVSSRWFAPSAFKKVAAAESTKGTYVPHWTFDAEAFSAYSGQQGRHYWVTENDGEGRTKRAHRRVRPYAVLESGRVWPNRWANFKERRS